jgi:hypothetical protein
MANMIKTDFIPIIAEQNARAKRIKEAQAYSEEIHKANRNKAKKRSKVADTVITFAMLLCIIGLVAGIVVKATTTEHGYYKKTETMQSNGNYFVYVTERICEVEEINNDLVTVEYKGKLYDFFGYGYEVGEEIICQFTNNWEIIGVTE